MSTVGKTGAVLLLWMGVCGCVTGKVLYLPGGPARPASQATAKVPGGPAVAVLDFSWEGSPSFEIGRDYDQFRPIVWKGNPGKAIADLIAGVLAEKGVPTARAAGEADVPSGIPAKVWGRVEEFRVNVKRVDTLKVEAAAVVAFRVFGSGGAAPPGWSSAVTSTYWYTDPLFITPDGTLQAVNGAANSAAEEGVRRLTETGVVVIPGTDEKGERERN
jgi:hypothetical protein